jgi:hypothetical protein
MLTLVVLVVWVDDRRGSRGRVDSAMWWYVARASGLIAWVLLGAVVVDGLLLATPLTRGHTWTWIQGLREFVGARFVVFAAPGNAFSHPREKVAEDYASGRFG